MTTPNPPARLDDLRERARAHIQAHRPNLARLPGTRSPEPANLAEFKTWCASLFSAGLIGADWPLEWGGSGPTDPLADFVVDQELANAQVPRPIGAWNLVSEALFGYGRPEQKSRFLPRIRSFDDLWCQLFSEPEAGSDLASLRTTAVASGAGWIVNGEKVWTTHAHVADLGFLLARTDPDVAKHAGISAFIVDMQRPGITVRPLREMTGSSDFNQVFFNDVFLPADSIIGEPGQGWEIARAALSHERSQSLREDSASASVRRLAELAERDNPMGPDVRQQLGRLYARSVVSDLLGVESVLKAAAGTSTAYDAPVVKVLFTETNLDIATYALSMAGASGVLTEGDEAVLDEGHWQKAFLFARGFTISAGSNEIMRNLISERGLGLPK
jgi:alkylation response protein AidB-like acyl-CoA dehydrogenase